MKSREIYRNIFGLVVRLLGLWFLYLGLSAFTPLLDLEAVETASKSDLINAILPVAFNLAVGWWLLGGGLLVRRAYPGPPRNASHSQFERATPKPEPKPSHELTGMDRTEQKLASLVGKPKS